MKYIRWTYLLSGAVFLGFAIQVVGINLTDKNFHPVLKPVPTPLAYLGMWGLVLSFSAPFLAIAGMVKAISDAQDAPTSSERRLIWTVATISVILSLPEVLWTMGGPTWYQGFNR